MKKIRDSFLSQFYRRFGVCILAAVVLSLPVLARGVSGALERTSNDVRQWLPAGFEETKQYDRFLADFGSEEMAVVSWPGATIDDARLDAVTEQLQSYVSEDAAESADSQRYFKRVTSTREAIAQLMASPVGLTKKQAIQRLGGLLVGPDGRTGGIIVMVNEHGAKHRKEALAVVQNVVSNKAGVDQEQIHIGGPTVDSVALDSESQRSRYLLSALSVTFALALAWRCLREVRLVVIVFFTALLSAATSVAIVHYAGDKMNLLLVMMPTLVYLTAMSGAVHLVNYYRDALQHCDPVDAPAHAIKAAFLPGFMCIVTTAVGLGSLGTSQVVPVRMFGTYSAAGVLAVLPILYLVLPSLLRVWPSAAGRQGKNAPGPTVDHHPAWTGALATWISRRHGWVFAGGVAAMILAGMGLGKLNTSVKLLNLFSPQSEIIQDYTWLEQKLGPLVPMEIVLAFPHDSPLNMMGRLELVQQVESQLSQLEKVGGTMSAATFAPVLPQGHSTRQLMKRVVMDRRLKENRDYFEDSHYLKSAPDAELWRISARVEALNSLDYGHFVEHIRSEVQPLLDQAAASGKGNVDATYTGIVPLVYKAQRTLLNDLMSSFLSAFLIIGAMMVVMLRNLWAGLASMIPNIFPAITIFGTMGLAGVLCDIGSMMTAGVALGIAVDDTIHFLSWFRRGLNQGLTRHEAIVAAYRHCAVPMIQSSVICGLGLLVFAFSNFIPTARFAWLMATMLASALFGDLILLPAILAGPLGRFFEPRRSAAVNEAESLPELPAAELVPA